ncbi:MAG: histidine phosphatase family protein [Candidatus Aenigmarchaeota archaeon]|nr:histidine phosphatase family protein [Candidatus Aenigmarchaeota archaeon]
MKRVYIAYFVHGTTTDNEKGIATGWNQGELSVKGIEESIKLGKLARQKKFDAVFCSDLKRAVDSAKLAFGGKEIIIDSRLRECNYGRLNGQDGPRVGAIGKLSITRPFPGGESYLDVEKRVREFLHYLAEKYEGKRVAIVSHRGPQLSLEVITNGRTWEQAFREDWRFRKPAGWKPGWDYVYEE